MTAKVKGWSLDCFIDAMQKEISRGFVSRSFRFPILRALTPCVPYSRADVLADTFDRVLFNGITLGELPERPVLCMNTTILNSGQIAKFGRDGFSAWGISVPGANPSHVVPWTGLPLARAVVASAAFPVGIPPLTLRKRDFPRGTKFSGKFTGEDKVYLTDGGVLENLGVQTLLKSHRYAAWNLIASDAGVHQSPWRSRGVYGALRGFLISLLSGRRLERIMLLMNEKQNRWARQMVYRHLLVSRLTDEMQKEPVDRVGMTSYTDVNKGTQRRSLLFVRVAQDWNRFFRSIPRWRLAELGERVAATESVVPSSEDVSVIIDLEDAGCNLTAAKEHYAQLGGDCGALKVNEVPTGFTALSSDTVRRLALHAAWQVHAAHAIYYLDEK